MARRNANIMKTILLAFFYCPIFPLVWPITILSLIAEYWTAKYLLLRRHSRPHNLGNQLDKSILTVIKLGVFCFSVSNLAFHYERNVDTLPAGITGLLFCFFSLLFPFQQLWKMRSIMKQARRMDTGSQGEGIESVLVPNSSQDERIF